MSEEWRHVIGYKGIYQVSDLGNVRSLNYRGKGFCNNLKLCLAGRGYLIGDGYLTVSLSNKKVVKNRRVHQLVAESFLDHNPCDLKLVVNHKDFNRVNNNVENLEIVTIRENSNKKHLKSTSKYTGV